MVGKLACGRVVFISPYPSIRRLCRFTCSALIIAVHTGLARSAASCCSQSAVVAGALAATPVFELSMGSSCVPCWQPATRGKITRRLRMSIRLIMSSPSDGDLLKSWKTAVWSCRLHAVKALHHALAIANGGIVLGGPAGHLCRLGSLARGYDLLQPHELRGH